jgi:hypothetical protein
MIGGNPHWFVEEMTRRVAKERADRAEVVLNGMCQDFADYRYAAGFFEGMQKVIEIAEDIRKEHDAA